MRDSFSICPGCRLRMPISAKAVAKNYFNCSDECWSLFADIQGYQYGSASVFRQSHQLTVDAYACQHAGGDHPDKSVAIHLSGLFLAFELGCASTKIPRLLQRLADFHTEWPNLNVPSECGRLNAFDIALVDDPIEHSAIVRTWASEIWDSWIAEHPTISGLLLAAGIIDNAAENRA